MGKVAVPQSDSVPQWLSLSRALNPALVRHSSQHILCRTVSEQPEGGIL